MHLDSNWKCFDKDFPFLIHSLKIVTKYFSSHGLRWILFGYLNHNYSCQYVAKWFVIFVWSNTPNKRKSLMLQIFVPKQVKIKALIKPPEENVIVWNSLALKSFMKGLVNIETVILKIVFAGCLAALFSSFILSQFQNYFFVLIFGRFEKNESFKLLVLNMENCLIAIVRLLIIWFNLKGYSQSERG